MTNHKDTDLREALRRKYADKPQLPAGFSERMMKRMKEAQPRKEKAKATSSRSKWLYAAIGAIAASIALLIILVKPAEQDNQETNSYAQSSQMTKSVNAKSKMPPSISSREEGGRMKNLRAKADIANHTQYHKKGSIVHPSTSGNSPIVPSAGTPLPSRGGAGVGSVISTTPTTSEENLHYAAHSSTYQDPARVDEFIEKMAAYHNVKEGQLTCTSANDSNTVSRVYVFPDKKEIDVFGRLLQVACWFSDEMPGYHLNFSHQQFFFELKDQRRQLQYRWIAERISGRILLYGTHAPIGAESSSTCYQEYRNELMHINSINFKTREI
jgi:hypothetical protein